MVSKCSSSSSFSRRNVCGYGERIVLFTSKTPINPGWTFWRCPNWNKKGSCDYFEGADEVLQQPGNVEDWGCNAQEVADMKKKIAKMQRKISEERKMKKWFMGIWFCHGEMVGYWHHPAKYTRIVDYSVMKLLRASPMLSV